MAYFSHLLNYNQPNNRLQKHALAALEEVSNRLVIDEKTFCRRLQERIEQLNQEFPRCSPLHFDRYASGDNAISIGLGMNYTVSFHLYPVREPAKNSRPNLSN